ncbi:hypothetical protein GGF46_004994 [Coemansia sp. RSA 552]|nr:hypothetical protein GGF46_004994 [Coemansia sp. RSA 552]
MDPACSHYQVLPLTKQESPDALAFASPPSSYGSSPLLSDSPQLSNWLDTARIVSPYMALPGTIAPGCLTVPEAEILPMGGLFASHNAAYPGIYVQPQELMTVANSCAYPDTTFMAADPLLAPFINSMQLPGTAAANEDDAGIMKRRNAVHIPQSTFANMGIVSDNDSENLAPVCKETLASKSNPRCYTPGISEILNQWLAGNRGNPYPSSDEKKELMNKTGLTKMQLKNWFCNVRRRKLPGTIRRPKGPRQPTRPRQPYSRAYF